MTHVELRDSIIKRIGFLNEVGAEYAVSAEMSETLSGRTFQDEHPSVTLANIEASMSVAATTTEDFNNHLALLRKRAIILVISDVFSVTNIQEDALLLDNTILDKAISIRMAILVGESILNSTRSNRLESINKQTLFLEIEGREGKFVGLKGRYEEAVRKAKNALGQENALGVSTIAMGHTITYLNGFNE